MTVWKQLSNWLINALLLLKLLIIAEKVDNLVKACKRCNKLLPLSHLSWASWTIQRTESTFTHNLQTTLLIFNPKSIIFALLDNLKKVIGRNLLNSKSKAKSSKRCKDSNIRSKCSCNNLNNLNNLNKIKIKVVEISKANTLTQKAWHSHKVLNTSLISKNHSNNSKMEDSNNNKTTLMVSSLNDNNKDSNSNNQGSNSHFSVVNNNNSKIMSLESKCLQDLGNTLPETIACKMEFYMLSYNNQMDTVGKKLK